MTSVFCSTDVFSEGVGQSNEKSRLQLEERAKMRNSQWEGEMEEGISQSELVLAGGAESRAGHSLHRDEYQQNAKSCTSSVTQL